jgi:DUF971 family protein
MTVTRINYARSRRVLELEFADGISGELSAEFLRVHSPSAEVRGHGPGQETLQTGKCDVQVSAINPVGHYAIQLVFDDGHDSGLFSWDYLRELCSKQEELWQSYLDQLAAAGASRDSDIQVLNFTP